MSVSQQDSDVSATVQKTLAPHEDLEMDPAYKLSSTGTCLQAGSGWTGGRAPLSEGVAGTFKSRRFNWARAPTQMIELHRSVARGIKKRVNYRLRIPIVGGDLRPPTYEKPDTTVVQGQERHRTRWRKNLQQWTDDKVTVVLEPCSHRSR